MKLYLTGGTVRDHMLGLTSKDVDFCVEADSYTEMRDWLVSRGLRIWQERPEFVTVRGQLPLRVLGKFGGMLANVEKLVVDADFTLCRAETQYSDKRHPDTVTPTDVHTDLNRRDFTMNAMAVTEDGEFLDPHNGKDSVRWRVVTCVGDPWERFTEDPLRMLRALRFAVTKDMRLRRDVSEALRCPDLVKGVETLPDERMHYELSRMFSDCTPTSLLTMAEYPMLAERVFMGRLWLQPSLKAK